MAVIMVDDFWRVVLERGAAKLYLTAAPAA